VGKRRQARGQLLEGEKFLKKGTEEGGYYGKKGEVRCQELVKLELFGAKELGGGEPRGFRFGREPAKYWWLVN